MYFKFTCTLDEEETNKKYMKNYEEKPRKGGVNQRE